MEYELHGRIKTETVITPTEGDAAGASTVGAVIDTVGFESLEYVVAAGTITTGDFTITMHESDTGAFAGEETVVPAELTIGAIVFAVTDDDLTKRQGSVGKGRYQRATLVGANTPVADMAMIAVLSHAQINPTAE